MLALRLQLIFDVRLHRDGGEARERVFLLKQEGESLEHVLMKLLGWMLFHHPDLRIEVSAEQHYKPDLVRFDERGEPVQWVDCGQTSLRKLDRIASRNRKSFIDIVKPTERELRLFKAAADAKIERPERVRYFAFRDGFVEELAARVRSRHQVEARVVGDCDRLELVVDGEPLSSPVVKLAAGSAARRGRR